MADCSVACCCSGCLQRTDLITELKKGGGALSPPLGVNRMVQKAFGGLGARVCAAMALLRAASSGGSRRLGFTLSEHTECCRSDISHHRPSTPAALPLHRGPLDAALLQQQGVGGEAPPRIAAMRETCS